MDEQGRLAGLLSRRDLLRVFLRPDTDIAADIRQVLDELGRAGPGAADLTVRNGIVTLTGTAGPTAGAHDLVPLATRLMWNVDGVIDIIDQRGENRAAPLAHRGQA